MVLSRSYFFMYAIGYACMSLVGSNCGLMEKVAAGPATVQAALPGRSRDCARRVAGALRHRVTAETGQHSLSRASKR